MLKRFRVRDNSMIPSFKEGDFVIVRAFRKLKKGDVIVFEKDGKRLLKRIEKIEGGDVFVVGDNIEESRDSRHFGPIKKEKVIGKVWIHTKV